MAKKIIPLLLSILLSACSLAATKDDIKTHNDISAAMKLNENYQTLLKCWESKADKKSRDTAASINTHIYSELGTAEITVTNPSNYYAVLIELKKLSPKKTEVSGFGIGYLGKSYLPLWLDTLNKCAD